MKADMCIPVLAQSYYASRQTDILELYETHSRAWRPFLTNQYGPGFAKKIILAARQVLQSLIPELPYIGGDDNPMTRHLIRSSTSLAFYLAMKGSGKNAQETGQVIYQAAMESVRHLPPDRPLSTAELAEKKQQAIQSRQPNDPGNWVWDFVAGDGVEFEYGYDFYECGTQKLYSALGADEFLPFYCYLDFVTYRTPGWSFYRTMTLAEGDLKCDFRFRKGGETKKGWPPPNRRSG